MMYCEQCGAVMVKWYPSFAYATDPPQYPYRWWCGCGHDVAGGVDRADRPNKLDELRLAWRLANITERLKL